MNVVIVGGGVMGRLFTGRLAAAGENVAVIDASPEVARSLNERGVWIEERDGSVSHAATRAGTDSTGLESPDIVLFFVKTEHTDDAADRVAPAIEGQTAVVTLQNGFGNAEALAARFPAGQIVYGATEQGGSLAPDGHVAHAHDGDTFVGPYIDRGDMASAAMVAAVLRRAGLKAEALPDVRVPLWQKRVFGAAVLPVAALTGLRAGDLLDQGVFGAIAALAAEAVAEANAAGCSLDLDYELHRIKSLLNKGSDAKASMLQDIEAHRLTEIDAITGAIADLATTRAATAPVCRTTTALVHGRELAWRTQHLGVG